jgi:hypothetical protein
MKQRIITHGLLMPALAILLASFLLQSSPYEAEQASGSFAIGNERIVQSKAVVEKPEKRAHIPKSEKTVDYSISVKLDEKEKVLYGKQTVTWRNPGSTPVNELYFHLYPNAFRSKDTTFISESGGKLRNDEMKRNNYGQMNITKLTTLNGTNVMQQTEFIQPDDGNEHDLTLLRLVLPTAVEPGMKVTLYMEFQTKLPYVFARMGYAGDFVMAGQWFPKIAAYEPKGTRGRHSDGWNLHQYHGNSEFYADFGAYNVEINVPANYTVAATGFPVKTPSDQGERKVARFYAENVHDFAWAASPDFVYAEETLVTDHIPGTKIKLYLDPKHADLKDRYMAAAKKSLSRYSEWYGPYPYPTLSVVVPPEGGNGAGGMEYPTLITAWATEGDNPGYELERVVVHEIGHQFWYGMIANNEFEEAWLDEAFTSYAEDKVMEAEYGALPNLIVESVYVTSPAPLKQASWDYNHHNHYADNVYTRGKLVLWAIESEIGGEQMTRVLKSYFHHWKFRHPTTRDFQDILEEETGKSWEDFFEQFVYGGRMTDYAVRSIQSKPVTHKGKTVYENTIVISKLDGHYTSVPIVVMFDDGSLWKTSWEGSQPHVKYNLQHTAPVKWVAIDPGYSIILENKRINNFLKAETDTTLQTRWNLGAIKIIETLIGILTW